jgi:hypothetical protein
MRLRHRLDPIPLLIELGADPLRVLTGDHLEFWPTEPDRRCAILALTSRRT